MKHTFKSLIAATAVLFATPAIAQSSYVQVDVGGAQPAGYLGNQLLLGVRGGLEFNKFLSAELGFSQSIMNPSTYLGSFNTTEFKITPYIRFPLATSVTWFAGPQFGIVMASGAASTNSASGSYGGTTGLKLNMVDGWSTVMQYEYTRSFVPMTITGIGYTDYYNSNKFTVGVRKTF